MASGRCPAIRVMMMPRDTNAHGTIFGGVLLSHIDQAGAVEAHRYAAQRFVTVAMHSVEFKQPVFVGDMLSFYTEVVKVGRTSITVRVSVEAEPFVNPRGTTLVTEATLVYVAVDENRRPIEIARPSGA
ncbi:MAG: acyl-CoA thioesterase [Planctomycetia bacterium]|nr:MAG: acyl-CoA thioesterase [Planctomycetia bacterium]